MESKIARWYNIQTGDAEKSQRTFIVLGAQEWNINVCGNFEPKASILGTFLNRILRKINLS